MSSTFAAKLKSCCELVESFSTERRCSPTPGNTLQAIAAQTLGDMCQKLADVPAQPKATLKKLLLKQEVRVDVGSYVQGSSSSHHTALLCTG
jgi:hypothetical protein